jgi:hypothetical protein
MENLGLIYGLSEGAKGFMQGMNDAQDRALKRKLASLQMAQHGIQDIGDAGEITYTPEKQSELDLKKQLLDPNSSASKSTQEKMALMFTPYINKGLAEPGILNQIRQESSHNLTDDKGAWKAYLTSLGSQNASTSRADIFADRNAIARDAQTQAAHAIFNNDTVIRGNEVVKQQLTKALQRLREAPIDPETNQPIISPQLLNEVGQDFAAGISGVRQVHRGTIEDNQYGFWQKSFANFAQKLTGSPKDVGGKPIVKYLDESIAGLMDDIDMNTADRAEKLALGRSYKTNPEANEAVKSNLAKYTEIRKRKKDQKQGLISEKEKPQASSGLVGPDKVRVQFNGKIMVIDKKDLKDAIADGAKEI